MSEPLRPELEAKAQELAARIRSRSEASILEMARNLVATTDDTLFGDTEFALRDQVLGLVADAYVEHHSQECLRWLRRRLPRLNVPPGRSRDSRLFHASEYLAKLAKAHHPLEDEAALTQTQTWSRILRDEGGEVMIAVLEAEDWPKRAGLAAVLDEVLGYFRNQAHRMDYPVYQSKGWYIGSGAVESACKTVVGQRLKGSGMRWSESGADAVCHVRALYRSEPGQWNAFWQRSLAA